MNANLYASATPILTKAAKIQSEAVASYLLADRFDMEQAMHEAR